MATGNFKTMAGFPLITTQEGCEDDLVVAEMEKAAQDLNERQTFFKVSVESGYYDGVQFYVEGEYHNVMGWDENDAVDEFGMTLGEVQNDYLHAQEVVREGLLEAAGRIGLARLEVSARFSNGETWYRRVD